MTNSREDAQRIVKAVRYPPGGERLWGPFYAPFRWGLSMSDYLATADEEILAIGVLESIDAVEFASEIVRTPGLDVVFIGAGDLATSMGLRGRPDHPDVQAAIARFEEAIRGSSVVLGGVATNPNMGKALRDRGYQVLMLGFDWSLLQRGIDSALHGMEP
jgi:4-hydroxy-2-oxoheptanedioate aldolase